jgi:uncharacterized protein (DUF697 family)
VSYGALPFLSEGKNMAQVVWPDNDSMKSHLRAERIVRHFALGALSVLLVPTLLAEWVLLPALQLVLIHKLCDSYGQKFVLNAAKAKITLFLSWLFLLSTADAGSVVLRHLPLIGTGWRRVSTALIGSASTYAIGKVFILHFESGGTLLSLDPEKIWQYYTEQFVKAQKEYKPLVLTH